MKPLARLAFAIAALYGIFFALGKIGNPYIDDVPDQGALRSAINPAPATPATPTTTPPPLPPGFPSMEFPPPKIDVPKGEPQPIATKFGLTYSIPPEWENESTAIIGWSTPTGPVTFSSAGEAGLGYCQDNKDARLGVSGASGRNGISIDEAALDAVHAAEQIFAEGDGRQATVRYNGPVNMTVSGRPAVRYTAVVTAIPGDRPCGPPSAHYDIVATEGYSTAQVMILMVESHRGLPDSPEQSEIDGIVASLRRS